MPPEASATAYCLAIDRVAASVVGCHGDPLHLLISVHALPPWLVVAMALFPPLIAHRWVRNAVGWLLDHPFGRWWPVPAAILPSCIPLVRIFQGNSPLAVQARTVMALLLAVAVLQLYGQERNNRDRIKTAAERIRERAETENRIAEQAALADEQRAILYGLFGQFRGQSARMRDIANDVSRLADAISALAAKAEEE